MTTTTQTKKRSNIQWQPDDSLFQKTGSKTNGRIHIENYLSGLRMDIQNRIITSGDIPDLRSGLNVPNMPEGIAQYQLPVFLNDGCLSGIIECRPGAFCPEHRHNNQDGFWLIIRGQLTLNGDTELSGGEWFFIPHNCTYSFTAGEAGCTIFHAHSPSASASASGS